RKGGAAARAGGVSRDEKPDGSGGGDGWDQDAAGMGPAIDERQGAAGGETGGADGGNQEEAGMAPVIDERQAAVEDPVAAGGNCGDARAERDGADDLAARHRRGQAVRPLPRAAARGRAPRAPR